MNENEIEKIKIKIPRQYLPVMLYLIVKNAKKFLQFSSLVFNAKEQLIVPNQDSLIVHGEIRIFNAIVMFADANNVWKEKTSAMYLYVDDVKRILDLAVLHKAKALESPQKKEYGYTASFEDPFGNFWFIVEAEK